MDFDIRKIRPEYHRKFTALAEVFKADGVDLTAREKRNLMIIAAAVEAIDRCYDGITEFDDRRCFVDCLLAELEREGPALQEPDVFTPEVQGHIYRLKRVLTDQGERSDFLAHTKSIFAASDALRVTRDVRECIEIAMEEGQLSTQVLLCGLQNERSEDLRKFLVRMGGIMNLIDDLMDIREDVDNCERVYSSAERFANCARERISVEVLRVIIDFRERISLISAFLRWVL